MSVGLAQSAVLAPLAPALQRSLLAAGGLSLLLLGFGGVIVRDHVRAVRQQRALARSEERLNEAQQLAHVGSWELDLASGEVVWSDEVYRIFEVDAARTEPTFKQFLEWVHPDDRAQVRQIFEASVKDHHPYNVVHRLLLPDGRVKHVRERGVTEYQGERAVRSRGTVQDVTEVRLAQQALQQLNEQLEARVSERTSELAQANRELEAFTYSVSHDLRTPLRSIHGFATLLQESEAEHLSDEGKDFLRRIQESSRRMGVLITDLLSMARHSRADMHPEWVDLSALAQQVVAELERGEPQRDVRWEIEPGLRVQADPTLIRVVLQNLLGNAWKYTGQKAQAHIRLHGTGVSEDRQAGFCVSDNGAGFDMAYGDQLFQPFKRLHAHHQFEGTGIGLATVARVVERHGGRVRGEGVVGQGASFCFSLPLEPVRQFGDSTPTVPPRR